MLYTFTYDTYGNNTSVSVGTGERKITSTATGQGMLGNNMFAYCRNNPVRRVDISGRLDEECFNEDDNPLNDLGNPNGNGTQGGISGGTSSNAGSGTGGRVQLGSSGRISFSTKVLNQMSNLLDLFHSFPVVIDTMVYTTPGTPLVGGDGIIRTLVQIPGSINNRDGVFEYIIELDGSCNHRYFNVMK